MNILSKLAVTGSFLLCGTAPLIAQDDFFNNWPAGTSPQEVGKRVADHFITSPHQYGPTIHYSEVATWYGALTFCSTDTATPLFGKNSYRNLTR